MTYNFDPERWLENHQALLQKKLRVGAIDKDTFAREREALEQRYQEMCDRLDGQYRLPDKA